MPSSTLDDLLSAYCRVSSTNRFILERFALIAQEFQKANIPVLLLKGADVISRLYGLHGTRPLSDVDLLVHEIDMPAIDRLLTARGFVQQIDGNPSYVSPDSGLSLDLVTSLWYLDNQQLDEVWGRSISRPFPPITIACLATEDLLIHLTAYAVVHRGQVSAAFSQDLRLLIQKESPDWQTILTRARQHHLRIPLYHGLSHIRRTYPEVSIADNTLSQLAPRNRHEMALAWILRKLVTSEPLPELGHLLLLLTCRRGMRGAWLRETLFPSSTFLSYRYGQSGLASPWITRLRRIADLLRASWLLFARIIRRLKARPARQIQ